MRCSSILQLSLLCFVLCVTACSSGNTPSSTTQEPEIPSNTTTHYTIESIQSENIEITSLYDTDPNTEATSALASYDKTLGQDMNLIIGSTDGMNKETLAGLATQIICTQKDSYPTNYTIDIGLINLGGIRAELSSGDILKKDIYSIFAFENEITILPLTGQELKTLVFDNKAYRTGPLYNVSIDTTTKELKVKGQIVEDTKIYWIGTLDYLADGNSGLTKLADLSLADQIIRSNVFLRDMVLQYIEKTTKAGQKISYVPNEYTLVK